MFRDATYSDLTRADAIEDASTAFVMDEDAFRGFYERTARGLCAYLARVTGNREVADDLLQETYYRFLRAAAAHDSETHRRNSLYRIATNLARDLRRRNVNRGVAAPNHDMENVPSGADADRAERMADFSRAMAGLKPREREMLWLAYAEGASHREIADVLGLRPASLKPLLFRARRKMAELLGARTPRKDDEQS